MLLYTFGAPFQLGFEVGPSLHSPWAMPPTSLANIVAGFLINAMPFQFSWARFLVSISTWMQVAAMCHHPVSVILGAMKAAIYTFCSRAAWCVDASIQWAVVRVRSLPTSPSAIGCVKRKLLIFFVLCKLLIFSKAQVKCGKKLENVWHVTYASFVMRPTPKKNLRDLRFLKKNRVTLFLLHDLCFF